MTNRRQFLAGVGFAGALAIPLPRVRARGRRLAGRRCGEPPAPQFLQPDYQAWLAATNEGLTEDGVREILGEPLERENPQTRPEHLPQTEWEALPEADRALYEREILANMCYGWHFGRLDFRSPSVPVNYDFNIYFQGGRVVFWSDPFERPLSTDGIPTAPRLHMPMDRMVFDSYIDVVDFRWQPPSGIYPMTFTVEYVEGYDTNIEAGEGTWIPERVWLDPVRFTCDVPHLAMPQPGQPCRWRVKARNALGEGPWSDWWQFRSGRFTNSGKG